MSVYSNIQRALETRLDGLGPEIIAWPNTKFTPTHGVTYLEPIMLPITSNLETLNDYHRYTGIFQVNVSVPVEEGTATLTTWLDSIHDRFLSEKRLTAGGDTVFIQSIERGPTQRDTDNDMEFYRSNVDINFIVYT